MMGGIHTFLVEKDYLNKLWVVMNNERSESFDYVSAAVSIWEIGHVPTYGYSMFFCVYVFLR